MSKFLLNLLLQISKALVNSKTQFLIRKLFFLYFRPGRPRGPFGLWPSQPTDRAVSHRPKQSQPAHPSRVSIASSREIRFPFQITPSRAGRLSLVSLSTGPHLSESPPSPCRLIPVGISPRRRCPAPRMPPSSYSPPSSLSPLNPLQTER
jgi:hypothetical protein